jgi:fibronectin-binding autotransporter adhesin
MISHRRSFHFVSSSILMLVAQQTAAFAANGSWTNPAGGTWSNPSNWLSGSIANGTDALADFSTINLTADATVALDSARAVGVLKFGDATPSNNWFLTNDFNPANILTLSTSAGTPDIIVNNNGVATISAALAGTQGLVINGPGTLTLSGANTYTGTTTINANATLIAAWSAGGTFAPLKGNIIDAGALTLTRTLNDANFTGAIFGNGTTTITGDGGFLNLGSPGDGVARLSNQSDLTLNIGLNLFKNAQTIGALNGVGDITSNTGGAAANVTLAIGNNNDNGTFSGIIDNNGSEAIQLIKTGSGTQILTGHNTYAGGTVVNSGILQIGDGSTPNAAIVGNVSIANGTLTIANPNTQTFAGALTGSGVFLKTGAGNLSLAGNNAAFAGTINVNGGTLTIAAQTDAIALNVGASGIAGQSGSLVVPATGDLEDGAGPLVIGASANSSGNVTVAGILQLDSLIINPTGTMTYTGNGKIQEGVTVNGGTLTTGSSFFVATVGTTIQNGGTWTSTSDFQPNLHIGITITGQNSLFHAQGNLTFSIFDSANLSAGGSMTADASLNLSSSSEISATGAGSTILAQSMGLGPGCTLNISAGALLTLSNLTNSLTLGGDVTINGGNAVIPDISFNGGNLSLLAGSLTTRDNVVVSPLSIALQTANATFGAIVSGTTLSTQSISTTGTTTINPGSTLTFSGGSLTTATLNGAGNISFSSGHLTILADDLTIGGHFIAPVLTVNTGSSISVSGNTSLPSGSVLTLLGSYASGNITNNGTMTVTTSANLTVGNLTNNGTLILDPSATPTIGGTITNNHIMQAGTSLSGDGSLINNDTLTIDGFLAVSKTSGFTNASAGVVVFPAGAHLQLTNVPLNNSGIVTLNAGLIVGIGSGALATNNVSGFIRGPGTIALPLNNAGLIDSGPGTLTFSGNIANPGTLRASAGGTLFVGISLPTNAGTINLAGGAFSSAQPLTNTGLINGFGTLTIPGAGGLTNNGSITFTDGPSTINGNVTNSANQTITITNQPAIFNNNVTNNGIIKAISTSITFNGSYTGNAYLSDPSTSIFNSTATVTPGGFMTGTAGDTFNFAGPTFTNNGNFTNAGSLQVATAIINNGNFTQSGPQSWSTGATFTNNAGAASFHSNAKLFGLTITAGTVDLTTSQLIIEPTSAAHATTLNTPSAYLSTHALISSTLPANFGLALLDNAALNLNTFGGNPADPNSLLLAPELLGDANADGTVDLNDLNTVLNHLGAITPAWTNGNFDHAPTIDLTDLNDVLNHLGLTNPNPSTTGSSFSIQNSPFSIPPIPTPEPTSLSLLVVASTLLFTRRRLV